MQVRDLPDQDEDTADEVGVDVNTYPIKTKMV